MTDQSWSEFDDGLSGLHRLPAKPSSSAPLTPQQIEGFGIAFVDGILAQVLLAVANIQIGSETLGQAFPQLQEWANDLQQQAANALSTATGAQSTANTANQNATTSLNNWSTLLMGLGLANIPGLAQWLNTTSNDLNSVINDSLAAFGLSQTGNAADLGNAFNHLMGDLWPPGTVVGSGNPITVTAVPTGIPQGNISGLTTSAGLWNAAALDLNNFLTTGSWASLTAAEQDLWQALFGSTTAPTTTSVLQSAAVPNITAGPGNGQSASLQALADGIHQSAFGGSPTGTDVTAAAIASALTQIPQTNIVIDSAAGATAVTFDAAGAGNAATGTSGSISTSWSHTIGTAANYLVVAIAWQSNAGAASQYESRTVTVGGVAMNYLGGVIEATPGFVLAFYGLMSPPKGAQTVSVAVASGTNPIYLLIGASSSYVGVGSVSTSSYTGGSNSNPAQTVSSGVDQMIVQAFAGLDTSASVPSNYVSLSGYNRSQRANRYSSIASNLANLALILGDAAGASSVPFSASGTASSGDYWTALAVCLETSNPGTVGSRARLYRASTSSVTGSAGTHQFPAGFYDSVSRVSTNLAQSGNAITVDLTGSYDCEIQTLLSINVASGAITLLPAVFVNGTVAEVGAPVIAVNGFGSQYAPTSLGGSMSVYGRAGDVLTPGYVADGGGTGVLTSLSFKGESSGVRTVWKVSLENRSLL